jgi:hypothetical protein
MRLVRRETCAISRGAKLDRSETRLVPRERCLDLNRMSFTPSKSSFAVRETSPHLPPDEARSVGDEARPEGEVP